MHSTWILSNDFRIDPLELFKKPGELASLSNIEKRINKLILLSWIKIFIITWKKGNSRNYFNAIDFFLNFLSFTPVFYD
jgi:hypothetical protein